MLLVPDERLDTVSLRETGNEVAAVLPNALDQIIGHADIDRAVPLVRQHIDVERHTSWPLDPRLRGGERRFWYRPPTPAHSRMSANPVLCRDAVQAAVDPACAR